MAARMKSSYNERLSFGNPLSRQAASRSTRYRHKRKRAFEASDPALDGPTNDMISNEPEIDDAENHTSDHDTCFIDSIQSLHCSNALEDDLESYLAPDNADSNTDPNCSIYDDSNSDDDGENVGDVAVVSKMSKHIYDGSPLTVHSSSVLMLQFKMRHNLTDQAVDDLLQLVQMHCPQPNQCVSSLYHFKKQFSDVVYPIVLHYYCSYCYNNLSNNSIESCANCKADLVPKCAISSFIEISISLQLKTILERDGIMSEICHCSERRRDSTSGSRSYKDIHDGEVYQEKVNSGLLTEHNVSFTLNTDGIPVFRSSGFAFWPILITINELPYRMRENVILAGLWYGSRKPDMSLFLKPTVESLKTLYNEGVEINPPPTHEKIVCRAFLLCMTCDLPAKAMVLNFTQFNGFYGCCYCLQQGETHKITERSFCHVYPYLEDNPCGPLRTHKDTCDTARSMELPVNGIKGPTWLSAVPGYNLIEGTSIDYMHCVLLGVCRQLLRLWLQSQNHDSLYYIGSNVSILDQRLCSIKPPNEIQRTPRSLETTLKFWKAHELRAWLIHYSAAVLHGILPEEFYQHHLLLIEGIYLLLKSEVTESDLSQSLRLIQHYCFLFSALYGKRNMTINVHNLLHLPHVVQKLGPLWGHSCFPFESINGELLNFFHGSQSVEKQVINHVSTIHKLPSIAETSFIPGSQQEYLYNKMAGQKRCTRNHNKMNDGIVTIGKSHKKSLLPSEITIIRNHIKTNSTEVTEYPSLLLPNKGLVTSRCKSLGTKRDNSGVLYSNGETLCYGVMEKIFTIDNAADTYCLLSQLSPLTNQPCTDTITNAALHNHFLACHPISNENIIMVKAERIIEKIVIIDLSSNIYTSRFPNTVEIDSST